MIRSYFDLGKSPSSTIKEIDYYAARKIPVYQYKWHKTH